MFGLEPQAIADRVKSSGQPARVSTLGQSIVGGMLGFMVVSLGGFAPWVLFSGWFHRFNRYAEIGLYLACLLAFLGLSGICLHRLIIGPGSLRRCYQLFSLGFFVYAGLWCAAYMTMRGVTGGIVGGVAGMLGMGVIIALGFGATRYAVVVIIALVIGNLTGYFIGEQAHNLALALKERNALGIVFEKSTRITLSKIAWGLCYGLGFGAGLGFAFYKCQTEARRLVSTAL